VDYTQLNDDQIERMLQTVGVERIADLFAPIPETDRLEGPLRIPKGLSEPELLDELDRLAEANQPVGRKNICFLGAGAYDHFVPSVVNALAARGEFVTAYTPYQAEASQGSLQAFYEYQTMLCQLTGMDVANASLYEAGSGLAEAILMAKNITGRHHVVVSEAVNPDYREVLDCYLTDLPLTATVAPTNDGLTDLAASKSAIDEKTAAIVVQTPNFFGCVEDVENLAEAAHAQGALAIVVADPISLGILKPPGDLGADICVGEGQPLGIPLQYGGPYLGILACRQRFVRRMPGRLVGATKDEKGARAFCLTLQTREQHIRREKATSNVCTNQGLLALRAAIYLAAMGKHGITSAAKLCLSKAHYAADRIRELDGYDLRFPRPFFKEFAVRCQAPVEQVVDHARRQGVLAGVPLGRWYPDLSDCFLVAVTEKRTREEIDSLVDALKSART
jgi:glycine dehydrogenase subunit 1